MAESPEARRGTIYHFYVHPDACSEFDCSPGTVEIAVGPLTIESSKSMAASKIGLDSYHIRGGELGER